VKKPVIEKGTTTRSDEALADVGRSRRMGQRLQQLALRGGPLIALILLASYLSWPRLTF